MSTHLREEPLRQLHHLHLHVHAHVDHPGFNLRIEINLSEEEVGHAPQRLLRPLGEPVDGAAVDQRGEHPQASTEGLSDGRQADHQVQVGTHPSDEEAIDLRRHARVHARLLARLGQGFHDGAELFVVEQVGHLSGVEDAVDILQEGLLHELRIVDHEHCGLVEYPCFVHHALNVLPPLIHAIALGDLDNEQLIVRNAHRQGSEGLPSGPADPHQQSVTVGLVNDARYPCNVLDCTLEEHQIHGLGRHLIVVIQIVIHHFGQGRAVDQLHVRTSQ